MEKKRPVGILALGWALIISGLIFQLSFWLPFKGVLPPFLVGNSDIYRITSPIVRNLALDPLWLFVFLEARALSLSSMLFLSLFRTIIVIICGAGILRMKNLARIILLFLSSIKLMSGLWCVFYGLYAGFQNNLSFLEMLKELVKPSSLITSLPYFILPVMVPLAYIIYLTHPKVKEMFAEKYIKR